VHDRYGSGAKHFCLLWEASSILLCIMSPSHRIRLCLRKFVLSFHDPCFWTCQYVNSDRDPGGRYKFGIPVEPKPVLRAYFFLQQMHFFTAWLKVWYALKMYCDFCLHYYRNFFLTRVIICFLIDQPAVTTLFPLQWDKDDKNSKHSTIFTYCITSTNCITGICFVYSMTNKIVPYRRCCIVCSISDQ
jgi:hypothetical protein